MFYVGVMTYLRSASSGILSLSTPQTPPWKLSHHRFRLSSRGYRLLHRVWVNPLRSTSLFAPALARTILGQACCFRQYQPCGRNPTSVFSFSLRPSCTGPVSCCLPSYDELKIIYSITLKIHEHTLSHAVKLNPYFRFTYSISSF